MIILGGRTNIVLKSSYLGFVRGTRVWAIVEHLRQPQFYFVHPDYNLQMNTFLLLKISNVCVYLGTGVPENEQIPSREGGYAAEVLWKTRLWLLEGERKCFPDGVKEKQNKKRNMRHLHPI